MREDATVAVIKAAGYCWAVTEDNARLRASEAALRRTVGYFRSRPYRPAKGPHWTVYLLRWALVAAIVTATIYGVSWALLRLMFG